MSLGALLAAPQAVAGTFTAFGPQDYTRGTGDPITVTNSFSVRNPNTQYTLKAFNGGLLDASTELVSSTIVTLNGVQIIGTNNFNQNVTEVDVPVTLQAANTLAVQVRGQPGGVLTIEVIGVDNDPPTIQATVSPVANAAGWNNTNVTVTFVCNDATSGVVSCPAPQTITTDGSHQVISGTATDVAGNTASTSVTLNIDRTPPGITAALSPAPNAAGWNNSNVTVSFTCSDSLSGVASCPSPTTITSEGANQVISGTATDMAGNTASTTVSVSLDKTPPAISISSPANGATFTSSSISATGSVSDALSGISAVTCDGGAATVQNGSFSCSITLTPGSNTITAQATDVAGNSSSASESVTFSNAPPPAITSFSPASGPVGTEITITGSNFTANGTATPTVALSQQGSGTIAAPIAGFTDTSISFIIPSGATTGTMTVTVGNQSAVSGTSLSVVASSGFSLTVGPSSAQVQQGTSTTYSVSLSSNNGFSQLASLSASGLPAGVTAVFSPPNVTAGQFSILTVSAPAGQPVGDATITISASATVDGIATSQTANVGLSVLAATTSLIGRTVESDNIETPIPGITITLLGVTDAGIPTGCSGQTQSDASGNFAFTNLPSACLGRQLVGYNGDTATDGEKYAGVNLAYTMNAGQVTGPELVHMPAISDAETIMVKQNASVDQVFSYSTIPGVVVTVYAGTTFTLPDGTKPDPFPMAAVPVPVDRLPDAPTPTAGLLRASIVAFQPADTTSNLPVSVTFPNIVNTPPGVNMELDTLDPIVGELVKYGTGTVSGDGSKIVPDADPAHPGHRYGITHFDWHGPMAPAPNGNNPCPSSPCAKGGDPVDLSSGLLDFTKTDIAFGGSRGRVTIERTYRTLSGSPGPFGIGTNHNYGYELDVSNLLRGTGTFVTLVMPDGNQFQFVEQGSNVFVNSTIPNLLGAVITSPASGTFRLRWKNGTVYTFQTSSQGALLAFLNSITDANGNTVALVRGNSLQPAQITQIVDPGGRSLNVTYDNFNRILSITDPIGRVVQYTYNSQGTLATVTDVAGGVTTYGYDIQNRMTSITDPRGITYLQNAYDANGRVVQQTAADGGVTSFAYTLLNPLVPTSPVLLTTVTDPLGNQTTYHFNPQGFIVDITDALGEKTVFNLDSGTSQVLSIVDPLARTTAFTYDSLGNRTSITWLAGTPSAVSNTFTYHPTFNRITSTTDALGNATTFKYDDAGNLIAISDAIGATTKFSYDGNGELASATDPVGNVTQFAYLDGNLARVADPLGRVTSRVTDAVGRLLSITNAQGQTTSYQYNPFNEVTQVTDPQHNQISFEYDGNGNLLGVTDPGDHKTSYIFDKMDRLATRTDPLLRSDTYQYDLDGNMTNFTDRRGVLTKYAYDALNRRTQANFGTEETINYSYDAGNRLIRASDSVTGTIAHSYDGLNRLVSEVTPQGNVTYSYDAAGRRTGMTITGQQPISYSYDNANRLMQIVQGGSDVNFSYDNDGRRTSLTLPNGVTISYSYDAASQLTGITYGALGNLTYSYDLAGRRSSIGGSFARTGMPNALASAGYNADNQLTQFGPSNLTYDANGNLTSDGTNAYTWDARNRLVSISGQLSANFLYDAFGRRVSKTLGGTTQYLYDLVNPVEELSGTAVSATTLTGLSMDEYFQRTDTSGMADFLTDALGTTVLLTASAGAPATEYTYDPFGSTAVTGPASPNPFQFTGREEDATSLYFYRARFYSPALQRFISEDPAGFLGGDANLYEYGHSNPPYFTDPSGECPACVIGIIGGVIGGAAAGIGAYESGARGWDLAAAIAGGAGAGILAGLTGAWAGQLAADLVAPSLGLGLGTQTIAGAVGGAAGGVVNSGVNQAISGCFSAGGLAEGAAEGAAFGAAGVLAGPTVQGGENFNVLTSPRTWGPRAQQAYAQAAIAGAANSAYDLSKRKNDNGCPQ